MIFQHLHLIHKGSHPGSVLLSQSDCSRGCIAFKGSHHYEGLVFLAARGTACTSRPVSAQLPHTVKSTVEPPAQGTEGGGWSLAPVVVSHLKGACCSYRTPPRVSQGWPPTRYANATSGPGGSWRARCTPSPIRPQSDSNGRVDGVFCDLHFCYVSIMGHVEHSCGDHKMGHCVVGERSRRL